MQGIQKDGLLPKDLFLFASGFLRLSESHYMYLTESLASLMYTPTAILITIITMKIGRLFACQGDLIIRMLILCTSLKGQNPLSISGRLVLMRNFLIWETCFSTLNILHDMDLNYLIMRALGGKLSILAEPLACQQIQSECALKNHTRTYAGIEKRHKNWRLLS
ncbi:hypothetical protein F5Y11DRAFT_189788 [Daldinia sp. FL1419]|nr:hypothetical protein F5Y11DRAFT_189788 [Daldinia sp. FL1419]